MCRMDDFPRRLIPHLFDYLFLEKEAVRKDYAACFAEVRFSQIDKYGEN